MEVEYDLQGAGRRPYFFRYLPRLVRFDNAPIDATGCAIDMYARATVIMASIFLGPALLQLASYQAQQEAVDANVPNDDETAQNARVYGFRPSSLLSNIAIVGGLVSTAILPVFGAVVDHTPYRRQVGAWTAVALTLIKALETIFLKQWLFVAGLQVCSVICFQLHIVAAYAYSAELSSDPTVQSNFQAHFFTSMFVSMILYMIEVLAPATFWDLDGVGTARWAVFITTITCVPLFVLAWRILFRDCPPIRQVPVGESLWTTGFTKLLQTHTVMTHDFPAVAIFLKTMMFSEAANAALATIATTYMSDFLQMTSIEIGVTILLVLIFGLPGSWLGHVCCHWYNPAVSTKLCLLLYMATTAMASLTLVPQNKSLSYVYGALWGVCQGWIHPQHTTIFVTITVGQQQSPEQHEEEVDDRQHKPLSPPPSSGQRTNHQQGVVELMGVFLFACQIISFLPPLVFTLLNEAGVSMAWGMASLVIYFLIGYWGLEQMGDYQEALDRVATTSNRHYHFSNNTVRHDDVYEKKNEHWKSHGKANVDKGGGAKSEHCNHVLS